MDSRVVVVVGRRCTRAGHAIAAMDTAAARRGGDSQLRRTLSIVVPVIMAVCTPVSSASKAWRCRRPGRRHGSCRVASTSCICVCSCRRRRRCRSTTCRRGRVGIDAGTARQLARSTDGDYIVSVLSIREHDSGSHVHKYDGLCAVKCRGIIDIRCSSHFLCRLRQVRLHNKRGSAA